MHYKYKGKTSWYQGLGAGESIFSLIQSVTVHQKETKKGSSYMNLSYLPYKKIIYKGKMTRKEISS